MSALFELLELLVTGILAIAGLLIVCFYVIAVVGSPIAFLLAVCKAIRHGWPGAIQTPEDEQMRPPRA